MSLVQFFRIFNRNLNLFLLSSLVLAILVFLFTRNLAKTYESQSEIYTGIASGLNVTSVERATIDYFATSNAFDNLINIIRSRQTLELTGEVLLLQHLMLDSVNERYIGAEAMKNLEFMFPADIRKRLLVEGDSLATLAKIQEYKRTNYDSDKVKLAFYDGTSPYSYKAISNVGVERMGNSDLIKLSYAWTDPGITQQTLLILTDVFTMRLAEIKQGQGNDVVEYFRKQVALAEKALSEKEQELKNFRIDNRIINYEEQTKMLASQKEIMEDEYQKELATNAAKKSSVARLEDQLELNREMLKYAQEVLVNQSELAQVSAKIAELEVYLNDPELLKKMRKEQERLKAQIKRDLRTKYQYSKTTEGVSNRNVLEEWLDYTLAVYESNARLEVFDERKRYFNKQYDQMAPLGSAIDKYEREIDVMERTYLELLNKLNDALMRQESEALSTGGIVVTAEPAYPLEPLKSKSLLLVLVAGVVGFIVPFGIVLVLEFLDNTIRTPERAEELTGQKLLGAFPTLTSRGENKYVDMEWLREHAVGLMSQNLRLETRHQNLMDKRPKYVLVYSTRKEEGKALVTHHLANELVSLNFRVLVVGYSEMDFKSDRFYDQAKYERNKEFLKAKSFADLIPANFDHRLYDYVFFIVSSVITEQYPISIVEQADLAINCINVNRSWKKGDSFALKEFSNTLHTESRLVANGVAPDYMDAVLGDIQKRRSFLRRFFKNVLSLEFKSKKLREEY